MDENCSEDSDIGAQSIQKYAISKNILSKHKTYNGVEPLPLEMHSERKQSPKLEGIFLDVKKLGGTITSRNNYCNKLKATHSNMECGNDRL